MLLRRHDDASHAGLSAEHGALLVIFVIFECLAVSR
jgi:hypothetical protein